MDATPATQLIQSLDARTIEARLAEISGEQRALRTLLRAARARERGRQAGQGADREAGQPADVSGVA